MIFLVISSRFSTRRYIRIFSFQKNMVHKIMRSGIYSRATSESQAEVFYSTTCLENLKIKFIKKIKKV